MVRRTARATRLRPRAATRPPAGVRERGLAGQIGGGADGDTDVGPAPDWRVVKTVADHRHRFITLTVLIQGNQLGLRRKAGLNILDLTTATDPLRGWAGRR
jgi:hypothetical protein